jgi:hypothetical protein
MNEQDEIARMRALWCEETSKRLAFHAEVERLRAELAALKAHDPLAEMWRELGEYQPQADSDGHGESWRRMCEERTGAAARAAARAAYPSPAASAAGWATHAAVALANAGQAEAESAIASIRRAKGER